MFLIKSLGETAITDLVVLWLTQHVSLPMKKGFAPDAASLPASICKRKWFLVCASCVRGHIFCGRPCRTTWSWSLEPRRNVKKRGTDRLAP